MSLDDVGEQLAEWGRVAILETRARRTGQAVRVAVGFVEDGDGSFLVAAGSPDADWARNLEADPLCSVTIADRTWPAVAEPLSAESAAAAVRDLILRYGTPAEGLGRGPAFRLRRQMT
jgi:deazaflavin-dependent oxidoreductase (nitroreductase family)